MFLCQVMKGYATIDRNMSCRGDTWLSQLERERDGEEVSEYILLMKNYKSNRCSRVLSSNECNILTAGKICYCPTVQTGDQKRSDKINLVSEY